MSPRPCPGIRENTNLVMPGWSRRVGLPCVTPTSPGTGARALACGPACPATRSGIGKLTVSQVSNPLSCPLG